MSRLLLVAFEAHEASSIAGFAQQLGLPFDILSVTGQADLDLGAQKVLTGGLGEVAPADGMARPIAAVAGDYSHVAALSNMRSKDVMARVAGLLDAAMVTDAISLNSPMEFTRPVVAGTVVATVEVLSLPVVITVRPAGFPKAERGGTSEVQAVELSAASRVKRSGASARSGSRPDLSQAKVVVSGGRPLKDAETFERILGGLADALGGAVGATRAAVDSGLAANELQVGQTGKIVAPDLYIAAGVSGSTQHMAGIKDSKIIVAINKDPDAPIFESADYGIVGDLFEILPELQRRIED